MNGWTPGLQAAQQSASPRWALSLRAASRSTTWQQGGDPWEEVAAFPAGLATWAPQSIAAEAANGDAGMLRLFLSWWEGRLACQYVPAANLGASATWTAPAVVTVATFAGTGDVYTPKPALIFENGRWHCFYRLPAGAIAHRSSTNNGTTWSGATTIYSGGDLTGDLFALYIGASNLHLLQFSTQPDVARPRGASRLGHTGAWNLWPASGDATGWLPCGLQATGALAVRQVVCARTTAPNLHLIGRFGATLNADGTLASRDSAVEVAWSVTGDGALRPRKVYAGRGLGGPLLSLHESGAARAYICAAGIDAANGRLEEPLILSAAPLAITPQEGHFAPLDGGLESWLVGLTRVYRTVHRWDDSILMTESIIGYRFDADADSGGRLVMELRPGSAPPSLAPGHALWLTRTCAAGDPTAGGPSGAVTLGLRVVRVERHSSFVRLVALDALGLLAATVARRPLQFDAGSFTLAQAAEALVQWAGVRVERVAPLSGTLAPFQWQGGESGLVALRRLLRGQTVILRSRVASAGDVPTVWIGGADTGSGAAYGAFEAPNVQPLVRRVQVAESVAPRLAVVHGWAARNLPVAGEEWALALVDRAVAQPTPAVRPVPRYLLNRNLAADEQPAVANALRAALEAGLRSGWLEAQANLALEPHDWITVEGDDARVAGIRERWERGRLVQRVELAP